MNIKQYINDSANKKNILKMIFVEKEVSRNILVTKLKLSPATVTKFVLELINEGIVVEYGEMESTGGRKPIILRISPDYAYIISFDIGSFMTRMAIVGVNGEIITKESFSTEGFMVENLCDKIMMLIDKYSSCKILGIGIGISGMVDHEQGQVIFCPNIVGWDGLNVKKILEDRFGIHTELDTSSRCMACAENLLGSAKGIANMVFVSIGFGIGAGIILDSKILYGNSGFAGEFGHILVEDTTRRCTCGNYGCLELYVTHPLIIEHITKKINSYTGYSPLKLKAKDLNNITAEDIKEALKDGDKVVYDEIENAGKLIGTALANMANIINPKLIVLGGGVIENFPIITDIAASVVKKRSLIPIQQDLNVIGSSLGWDASIIGSAIIVINKLFL